MKRLLLAGCAAIVLNPVVDPAPAAAETFDIHVISAQAPRMLTVSTMSEFMLPEINRRLEEMGSEHRIDWRESYAGVVAGNTEAFSAIENQIGDMGQVGTLFEASRLPLSQMTFHVPFTGANAATMLDVMVEVHEEIPALEEAFHRHNQRVLSLMGTDKYVLATNFPVNSLDDLEGVRLGLPGSAANWVRGTGAVPVSSSLGDYYNSLNTGVYDGVIVFASALVPFNLYEVAPYITDIGMGAMQSSAITINNDVWENLPEVVRQVFTEVGEEFRIRIGAAEVEQAEGALARAEELGATVTVLPEDERQLWAETLPDLADEWATEFEARGLPARKLISAYLDGLREHGANLARDWDAGWESD